MISVLTMTACWMLHVCLMNNDPDPKKPSQAAIELQKNIQGKWLFPGFSLEGVGVPGAAYKNVSHSFMPLGNSFHLQLNGTIVDGGARAKSPRNGIGFIEFLGDSTYLIYDEAGRFVTGTFRAKTGDSIALDSLGSLSNISMADGKLRLKICYAGSRMARFFTGNKEAPLPSEERTTSICRKWFLTAEGNGRDVLGESLYMNESGQLITFIQDSIACLFTPSGTFILQRFAQGQLKSAGVCNWCWQSGQSNRFVYYRYNSPIDEEHSTECRELNGSVLKMLELADEDDDGLDEQWNWVLKPTN